MTEHTEDTAFETQFPVLTEQARGIAVENEEQFAFAAELVKQIKTVEKNVVAHYKPMKEQAKATHKTICDEEKRYLNPLKESENDIKGKMAVYTQEQERRAAIKAAELKARQEEHANEQLEKAEELREAGDAVGAAIAEQSAYLVDSMRPVVASSNAKAEGISSQTDYVIEVTDASLVPIDIAGVVIRPVDVPAVKRLVKMSKGNIAIPGIKITESKTLRVRA